MDARDKKRQQMLEALAQQFRNSVVANAKAFRKMKEESSCSPFTILEFIEFTSAAEFRKFREEAQITDEDLMGVDMDYLCRKLLERETE